MDIAPPATHPAGSAQPQVVVVGGGIAGMSAAIELAERGLQVTLLEAADPRGGKVHGWRDADGDSVEHGLHGQVTGFGSLVGLHLTPQPVRDYRSAASAPHALRELLHLACLNRGLFVSPEGMLNTSTAMSETDVTQAARAVQDALVALRPAIQAECPQLAS